MQSELITTVQSIPVISIDLPAMNPMFRGTRIVSLNVGINRMKILNIPIRSIQNYSYIKVRPIAREISRSSTIISRYNFSTNAKAETDNGHSKEDQKSMNNDFDYDNYDDYEPQTPGEKIASYTKLFAWLSLFSLGCVGIYYTAEVLFPGRMSPYSLYSVAFETVKINDQVRLITGEPMKAYGKDSTNEGRRTNIDYRQFEEDGSKRTRVRFNVKGPKGHVVVWAEVT